MGLFVKAEPAVKYPDHLEVLAEEAEANALARNAELFAEATAELEHDRLDYAFECRRLGDFLSIFIKRNNSVPEPDPEWDRVVKNYATALNLVQTREIRLIAGRPPDMLGELTYNFSAVKDDSTGSYGGTGIGMGPPSEGYHYKIRPDFPWIPSRRPLFTLDAQQQSQNGQSQMRWSDGQYRIKRRTPNFTRAAVDDQIRFNGIGASIFAPAGMGQGVLDLILAQT